MRSVKTPFELKIGYRFISHYRMYCAENGRNARAFLVPPDEPEYCVLCNSGLNAAGLAIMNLRRKTDE